jgi:autotransporter translocation and assembly factor TamB
MTAVGRTVASAIGLDALGLQIDELSSVRARLGAYVGRNIFVALAQEFSGERGQELSIEYEFWPGWSIVGSTTSQGTNSADLVWKVRY